MVDTAVLALQAARVDHLRPRARRLAVVIEREVDVADQVEVLDEDVQVAGEPALDHRPRVADATAVVRSNIASGVKMQSNASLIAIIEGVDVLRHHVVAGHASLDVIDSGHALPPPSTVISAALMKLAAGLHRNSTVAANSPGSP
jgi:hypothetical protein